jgi:hypothetical protein
MTARALRLRSFARHTVVVALTAPRAAWFFGLATMLASPAVARADSATYTPEGIHFVVPGLAAQAIGELPGQTNDLARDGSGNLYAALSTGGIVRMSSAGAVTPWSTETVSNLALASDGRGFGAGGSCQCLRRFEADGTSTILHQDASNWSVVAPSPTGGLVAATRSPGYGALYDVDVSTGDPSTIVDGGPGAGGVGYYYAAAFGSDGALYVATRSPGELAIFTLLRLSGTSFTPVATGTVPVSWIGGGPTGLVSDGAGKLYLSVHREYFDGHLGSEIWEYDQAGGTCRNIASAYNGLVIECDPSLGRLYAAETTRLRKVWAIMSTTPAAQESWGSIKAQYRGEREGR